MWPASLYMVALTLRFSFSLPLGQSKIVSWLFGVHAQSQHLILYWGEEVYNFEFFFLFASFSHNRLHNALLVASLGASFPALMSSNKIKMKPVNQSSTSVWRPHKKVNLCALLQPPKMLTPLPLSATAFLWCVCVCVCGSSSILLWGKEKIRADRETLSMQSWSHFENNNNLCIYVFKK